MHHLIAGSEDKDTRWKDLAVAYLRAVLEIFDILAKACTVSAEGEIAESHLLE